MRNTQKILFIKGEKLVLLKDLHRNLNNYYNKKVKI